MKWHGKIGFEATVETRPGIWEPKIIELDNYYGDTIKTSSRWTPSSDSTNDDVKISNQISIVADPFAYQNFHTVKYVEFMGALWKVSNVDVQPPRLILTLGGVYNGEQA